MQFLVGSAFATGLFFSTFSVPVPMAEAVVEEGAFRPVFYGGEAMPSACGNTGQIVGLKGDRLAVRNGPGSNFAAVAGLDDGAAVWLCDRKGDWIGVVFEASGESGAECGTDEPTRQRLPYVGPCRSGWVPRRWVGVSG